MNNHWTPFACFAILLFDNFKFITFKYFFCTVVLFCMVTNVLLATRYSLFVTFYSLLIDLRYWYLSYIRTNISPSNPIAFENHWIKIGLYHKYFSGKFHWTFRTPSNGVFTVSMIISRIEKNIEMVVCKLFL